jgi:5'(3')-deoxyribonucleotidase
MNKIAVIDIDATVVDSPYSWYKWLEDVTKVGFDYEWVSQWYDFSIPYGPIWKHKNIGGSPFDFWRGKSVYDNLVPKENAVECLETLKKKGYKIVFASALKGDHHKSKYGFVERYFPYKDVFHGTKEKGFLRSDLVIDDRNFYLNQFTDPKCLKIQFDTPHDQDQSLKVSLDLKSSCWYEIEDWAIDNL